MRLTLRASYHRISSSSLVFVVATCVALAGCTPKGAEDNEPSDSDSVDAGGGRGGSAGSGRGGSSGSGAGGSSGSGAGGSSGGQGGTAGTGGGAEGGRDAAAGADATVGASDVASETRDAGPPPKLPDLPGTVVLLDATKGITAAGDKVSRWADQSGKKNDAINGNAGFQPQLVMVGDRPAVHFSGKRNPDTAKNTDGHGGTMLRILDNASVQFGTGDWIITMAIAYTNELDGSHNGGFGTFYGKYADNGEILFSGNWTRTESIEQACLHLGFGERAPGLDGFRGSYDHDKTHPLNDGKLRIITGRRLGTTIEVRINGVRDKAITVSAGADLSFPGANIGLGSFSAKNDADSSRALKGDLYYMTIVKGKVSDDDVAALEGALAARFDAAP